MAELAGVEQDVQARGQGVSPVNKGVAQPRSSGLSGIADAVRSGLTDLAANSKDQALGDDLSNAEQKLRTIMLDGNAAVTNQRASEIKHKLLKKHGASALNTITTSLDSVTSNTSMREVNGKRVLVNNKNNQIIKTFGGTHESDMRDRLTKTTAGLQEDAKTYSQQLQNTLQGIKDAPGEGLQKHAPDILDAQMDMIKPFNTVSDIADRMSVNPQNMDQANDRSARVAREVTNAGMVGLMDFNGTFIKQMLKNKGIPFTPENATDLVRAYKTDFIAHVNDSGVGSVLDVQRLNMAMEQQISVMSTSFTASANGDVTEMERAARTLQLTNLIFTETARKGANEALGQEMARAIASGTDMAAAADALTNAGLLREATGLKKEGQDATADMFRNFNRVISVNTTMTDALLPTTVWGDNKSFNVLNDNLLTTMSSGDYTNTVRIVDAMLANKDSIKTSFTLQGTYDTFVARITALKANLARTKDGEKNQALLQKFSELYSG